MSTHLELRHLRAFVAVAEELHFTRAAQRLHLAQQALSAQVRQLEDELGTQLFERTTRSVELTEAGRTLLAHATPILAAVTAAWEQTARAGAGELGRLAVCYTPTVADEALPMIVDELHARYPAVRLRACEMWQAESVEAVSSGRFDVGLARCPVGLGDDLECASIREEPLGVVLACGHRLAGDDAVAIEALGWETLYIWPRELSPGFFDHVLGALRAHGFTGPVREFENLGRDVLMSDAVARRAVAEARAFSVAFATMYQPLPAGFAWRPLDPAPLVPLHMFWKRASNAAAGNFTRLALDVAERAGWLAPATGAAA
jgi:DNA-binding transcriptional LysR family regulator